MATNGIINGTKFGIYDNSSGSSVLVAFATSGSISINHSARETSNKESAGWKEKNRRCNRGKKVWIVW